MQNAVTVTKTRHPLAIEQMRIDPCHLRCHVGAQAERLAGELIHQLEGPQQKIRSRSGQQRIQILQHRRHDVLVAVNTEQVEDLSSQMFNLVCFVRERVSNVLG